MIYLDYQATTPLAPEAREAMIRHLDGPDGTGFGNPHSPHRLGRQAAASVEAAREKVAALFPSGGRVIFTSGATEALNLAIRGTATGEGPVAFSAIEHSAVGDTARAAGAHEVLKVEAAGICRPEQNLGAAPRLIAIMQANNEIGVTQPLAEWAKRARDTGALMLVDAVQAYGKMAVAEADLIAISAHKFHGPKGVGALWVRNGVDLSEVQTGGGQEHGIRSGTLSPALIAGMGTAAALAKERMEEDAAHIAALWAKARDMFEGWSLNGSAEHRYFGNMNIRKSGLDVARLMSECRTIMFSAGSACASGSGRPSHVLKAIGLSDAEAKSAIRLGWGRYTSMDDLEEAARTIIAAAKEQELWG